MGGFLGILECLLAGCAELSPATLDHHRLPPAAVSEALCPLVGKGIEEIDLTDMSEVSSWKRMYILTPKDNKLGF